MERQIKVRVTYEILFDLVEDENACLVVDDDSGNSPEEAVRSWIQDGYLHEFAMADGEMQKIELELPHGQVVKFDDEGNIRSGV